MDPITIGLLVGGGAGLLKGMANEKKMERQNKYRAEAIKYSPWTGMGDPGTMELPGTMESLFQGAGMGAMTGNMMGNPGITATGGTTTANMGNQAFGGNAAFGMSGMNPYELQKWQMQNQAMGGSGQMVIG